MKRPLGGEQVGPHTGGYAAEFDSQGLLGGVWARGIAENFCGLGSVS